MFLREVQRRTASSTAGGRRVADRHLNPHVVRVFGDMRFRVDSDLSALTFAPDGTAWTVEESGILRQWDGETGKQLARHELSDVEVIWAFSPDARLLASGSDGVSLWNAADGSLLCTLSQPSWVTAMCFRNDGKVLATGHDDALVRLWDLQTGALLADWAGHDDTISALAFSTDGQRLASASEDKIICVWELGGEEPVGRLEGHTDRIQALAWHPSGNRLVSVGWDTTARVWDAMAMEPVILLNGHGDAVSALAFSPDGNILASADSDRVVWLWDFIANKPLHQLKGHLSEITCLAFHSNGKRLLSGGQDRRLLLWDIPSGRNLAAPRCRLARSAHQLKPRRPTIGLRQRRRSRADLGYHNRRGRPSNTRFRPNPRGLLQSRRPMAGHRRRSESRARLAGRHARLAQNS